MNLENIKKNDMDVYNIIESELARQRNTLELIASENFTSKSVLEAVGSVLTNNMLKVILENVIMEDVNMLTKLKI